MVGLAQSATAGAAASSAPATSGNRKRELQSMEGIAELDAKGAGSGFHASALPVYSGPERKQITRARGAEMNREDVIKRLESAIEGSRELDANIAALAWPGAGAFYVTDGDRPQEVGAGEWLVLRRTAEGRVTKHRPADYTTSTDAALLLVPKMMGWEMTFLRREHLHMVGMDLRR